MEPLENQPINLGGGLVSNTKEMNPKRHLNW